FMTRQIAEISASGKDFRLHITSLNPIRPNNKPTDWEAKMLEQIENGNSTHVLEHIRNDSTDEYRFMAPLVTEQACLSCHSHQGYQVGDIRGGISITFPAQIYNQTVNRQVVHLTFAHLVLLVIGWLGIRTYFRSTSQYLSTLQSQNKQLALQSNELTETNNKLAITISEKDKFFSILAHDLRNPFFNIMGFAEILSSESKSLSKNEIKEFSKNIYTSSQNTYQLLEELLEWGKIQQGRVTLEPIKVSLDIILENACRHSKQAAKDKGIEIECELARGLFVIADRQRTQTIIRNLVSNAVKFSETGTTITISTCQTDGNMAKISIKDEGIGMNEQMVEKLFLPQHAKSEKGTRGETGTGMGLLLCKEFVTLQGGEITVESLPGKGTTFTFTLPLAP
ncbi:MAG: ATP-binding protein, partial [Bacteroidota bacterium]